MAFFYVNSAYVYGITNPLVLFVAPRTTNPLSGTNNHLFEKIELKIETKTVSGRYYDGMVMLTATGEKHRT